jgi:hypothetical protein
MFEVKANFVGELYESVSRSFRTESVTKYTLTFGITRWEAIQRVVVAKLTTLTHKIAIQLHLVAEICTTCSSRSRWPVRKLLDTPSYIKVLWNIKQTVVHQEYLSVYIKLFGRTRNRDSSVSTVTRLRHGRPGFNSRHGQRHFLFATASIPALGLTHPPIKWALGFFPRG